MRDNLKDAFRTIDTFEYESGNQKLLLKDLIVEITSKQNAEFPKISAEIDTYKEKFTEKYDSAFTDLEKIHSSGKNDSFFWTTVVTSEKEDDRARRQILEKIASPLIKFEDLKVTGYFVKVFKILLAVLPELKKEYSPLLNHSDFHKKLKTTSLNTLRIHLEKLQEEHRPVWEALHSAVMSQLSSAGEIATAIAEKVKNMGIDLTPSENFNLDKIDRSVRTADEITKWVDTINFIAQLIDQNYNPRKIQTPESSKPSIKAA